MRVMRLVMAGRDQLAVGRKSERLHIAGRKRQGLGLVGSAGVAQDELFVGSDAHMPAVLEKDERRDPIGLVVPGLNRVPAFGRFGRDALLGDGTSARDRNGHANQQDQKESTCDA